MARVNSYVYKLMRGELITITNLRATGINKFQSPAEIEIVVISTSLIFDAVNAEKIVSCVNYSHTRTNIKTIIFMC